MKKLMLSICMLVLILPVAAALTASIGNPRAVIRTEGSPDDPAILDRTLTVHNRNDVPVKVTISPDRVMQHFISDYEPEVILDPDQSKDIAYRLTIDRGGRFDAKINVGFWPVDPEDGGNGAGLTAALIILSEGPVIEFPQEAENQSQYNPPKPPVEIVPGNPDLIDENATISVTQDNFIEPETPDVPDATGRATENVGKSNGPSPLAGILIIIFVLAIGVGVFLVVKRR